MSTNKDQVKGRIAATTGKIKEEAGNLVGNEKLQARGNAQKNRGKAQAKRGDANQRSKDAKKHE